MKRWNGWGDENNHHPLKPEALAFLKQQIGVGQPLRDARLDAVIQTVPDSRLPSHPLISHDKEQRVRHARGQSLPDWLAMRSGDFECFPDGVAFPEINDHVKQLLRFAVENQIEVIPYGGGSSVVGHINPQASTRPVLTISMQNFNRLLHLDKESN
ncbi:MAG: FAD-dependent oxidoreductase, partial [Pseudomonadales bacterium]|nr:FAD-dependent oxidoreductase [Pseudomonadales bacterium]